MNNKRRIANISKIYRFFPLLQLIFKKFEIFFNKLIFFLYASFKKGYIFHLKNKITVLLKNQINLTCIFLIKNHPVLYYIFFYVLGGADKKYKNMDMITANQFTVFLLQYKISYLNKNLSLYRQMCRISIFLSQIRILPELMAEYYP